MSRRAGCSISRTPSWGRQAMIWSRSWRMRAAMTERYLAAFPGLDRVLFLRSGAILAVQRNCKILGIFTRLWRRDGKPAYLPHIARTWRLIEEDAQREPVLRPIADWLDRHLPSGVRRAPAVQER